MRTHSIFRYLIAIIIALGTTVNAMAQQRNLKIYFNQYVDGTPDGTKPVMLVTDDNDNYGLPAGLTFDAEGMAWAKEARFFEWMNQNVNDRLIADYVKDKNGKVDKKNAKLKISFGNFPYEVNGIQWNVMNDLLSGSITDFFKNYNVETKCEPVSGSGFTYTEEHWAMNIFQHSTSFVKGSIPWKEGAVLNGLKSFELSEKYYTELGLGNWTFINFGQAELSAKCRTFFKAGWNGVDGDGSNISDSDDDNWAFKLTFTLPEIRVRNSRDLYVGDENKIEGYIYAHPGAVVVTTNPTDPDKFHYEYFANNNNITINRYNGVIKANNPGSVDVTVKLYRGSNLVTSYTYEQKVLDVTPSTSDTPTPEICIVFANGKKGYDVSVGDDNVQIHGQIIKRGDGIRVTNNHNGYHYEYTSANTEIAEIDQYTGDITPKKEGDVEISAVLKNGNTAISNTYTYMLHVFAPNEGLTWQRDNKYYYYHISSNKNSWEMNQNNNVWNSSTRNPQTYDWKPTDSLKANTVIADKEWSLSSDTAMVNWKQIAWFKTEKYKSWRAICQKIELVAKVPKYSTLNVSYRFAANIILGGSEDEGACKLAFELKDLGVVTSSDADSHIKSITWNLNSTNASTPTDLKTLVKGVRTTTGTYIGVWGNKARAPKWEIDNKESDASMSETRYLVAMANLGNDRNFPAEASFGYKDIPTYTYYSHVYYCKNYGENVGTFYRDEELSSKGKTGTMQMNNFSAPSRTGHTFLGWSENPDATTPEYVYQDQFCSYDAENGGGKGPVYLYAVWRPNTYTVTLDHNDGTGVTEQVNAVYNEKMPTLDSNGNPLVAPVRDGYTFKGYYYIDENGTESVFYKADMTSTRTWRMTKNEIVLYAEWVAKTYTVELRSNFDEEGYTVYGMVNATYGADMPSVDKDGNALVVPTKKGYDFNGYYRKDPTTYYYDKDFNSTHVWDRTDNYIVVNWSGHKTIVHFDPQGGNNYGVSEVTATYGKKMPTEGVQAPQREGYSFGGYYRNANGQGTKYYNYALNENNNWVITSARSWNVDEPEVTLYAYWIPNTYTVTLDPQGGEGGSTEVSAAYNQIMPSLDSNGEALIAPTKPGYEFRGYYGIANSEWEESQGHDIYYGGKEYYDKDMNGVEPWDKTQGGTIYAHWAPKTYIVTLDADGGVLPKPVVEDNAGNFAITKEESNSVMTIPFVFGLSKTNEIVHSAVKKPGYEFLGWYDSNDVKVIGVEESRNCTITDNGGYWTGGGKVYNYTDNLTLTAHYRKKYKYADNVITFGKDENGNPEKVEADEDWLFSVVNDLVGSAQEVYQKTGQQTMVFDLRESINRWNNNNYPRLNVMQSLQKEEYKDYISPNVLVYFNDNEDKAWYVDNNVGSVTDCYNAVSLDNKCKRLVVTDRYSIKIPTAFSADEASYARDAKVAADDPAKDQAKNSSWGTLCLPYPIENDMETNHVKFYELKSMTNNYMEFSEMAQGAVIPANTPVLYNRTDGDVGSEVRIENWNVVVPMNADYTPVFKSYSDADESIRDWEFRGNLKTTVFYGKGYDPTKLPKGAQIHDGDVYYFKQNKFTYLNPDMDKNGKHYNAAMMTLYPYRAYFYRNTGGSYYSSTKVSAYSILVVGEDGTTLDITNTIFGDGEGDGKIYDLNGIRVMQPVKGRLYIVNGQKKVYR